MKPREMSRELRWVMLAIIIANTATQMMQPFIPLYLETIGARVAQVGIYFTIAIIFGIVFRVFGGWISDNVGRLPTIATGSVFGTLAIWHLC